MASANAKLRAAPAGSPGPQAPISHAVVVDRSYSSDETTLIRQAQAGRWEAFAELASHYDSPIMALALRLTGSEREARQLFQRAFSRAWHELRSYRFQCSFYLWIYRIAANSCVQFLQNNRRQSRPRSTPLQAAIDQLSPRERIVLELKHSFGLKLETIAAILETTEALARNTFVRAMLILRLECQNAAEVNGEQPLE